MAKINNKPNKNRTCCIIIVCGLLNASTLRTSSEISKIMRCLNNLKRRVQQLENKRRINTKKLNPINPIRSGANRVIIVICLDLMTYLRLLECRVRKLENP
ncbi:4902_t:CDS:2 [Scutellospora calospora]|uniref:4902_t:CDS:1 n=1 Tax=Scutellospora calospora TaxID=85575 RepID=A0ACA9MDU8_9GLOM|nr:4902_t:CDS:2 [Scutellospora calospora]